jgi:hypothetical protein
VSLFHLVMSRAGRTWVGLVGCSACQGVAVGLVRDVPGLELRTGPFARAAGDGRECTGSGDRELDDAAPRLSRIAPCARSASGSLPKLPWLGSLREEPSHA